MRLRRSSSTGQAFRQQLFIIAEQRRRQRSSGFLKFRVNAGELLLESGGGAIGTARLRVTARARRALLTRTTTAVASQDYRRNNTPKPVVNFLH